MYEEIKLLLTENLEKDFKKMEKSELDDCVNNLFVTYRRLLKKSRSVSLDIGIPVKDMKEILKEREPIIDFMYGAYISNRFAHTLENEDNIVTGEKLIFPNDLRSEERRKELEKYAYANKDMFIKQVIDQAKNQDKYKVGWTIGSDKKNSLVMNITDYQKQNRSLNEMRKKGFPPATVIRVHVVDKKLIKALHGLKQYKLGGRSRASEILNPHEGR